MTIITFEEIKKYAKDYKNSSIKLIPGALYKSGEKTGYSNEQLSKLLGVGNSSGIRSKNNINKKLAYIVCTITTSNNDWDDTINFETKEVIYYGDNYKNQDILNTKQKGNKRLKFLFENVDNPNSQAPIFLFYKDIDCVRQDFKFAGTLIPNYHGMGLEIITDNNGIKNYCAHFTLTEDIIDLKWINDILEGGLPLKSAYCPKEWK